jgi:starvation-inducible DNA-binding protein
MEPLIERLKIVLSTAHSLYLKAHYFHWNVTGPDFAQYHDFLGKVYEQVFESLDEYGERIRILGAYAPGSLSRFGELTRIQDEDTIPAAFDMLYRLSEDNKILLVELEAACKYAEALGQRGTVNFLEGKIDEHEKLRWMLNSFR